MNRFETCSSTSKSVADLTRSELGRQLNKIRSGTCLKTSGHHTFLISSQDIEEHEKVLEWAVTYFKQNTLNCRRLQSEERYEGRKVIILLN